MELSKITIKNNYVLLKINGDIEQLKSGLYIKGTSGDKDKKIENTEARHYDITGTVLAIPEKLVFRGKQVGAIRKKTQGHYSDYDLKALHEAVHGSLEYNTDVEVEIGDKVWFDYLAHINAVTEQKLIQVDGHGECMLIDYSRLFICERQGVKFPINGWIWIKKLERSKDIGNGLVLADSVDTVDHNKGVVFQVGRPISEYLSAQDSDFNFRNIKPGDEIMFNRNMLTPLEYCLHESEGLEGLFKIKRKDIQALIGVLA